MQRQLPRSNAEIAVNSLPFWSRFTLSADLRYDGVNDTNLIVPAGQTIPVFDYRKGDNSVTALEGAKATARDTILVQANQTRGGGLYRIYGVSYTKDGMAYVRSGTGQQNGTNHTVYPACTIQPNNGVNGPLVPSVEDWRSFDSFFTHMYLDNFRTEIAIDGSKRILEMGPAPLYPGVGGVTGSNVDSTIGGTYVANYMHIPEGIIWNPAGAVDSNLVLNLQATYNLYVPTWTAPDGNAPDGEPIPNAVRTPFGRIWTQAYIANFHGVEESPTSNIS